MEFGIKLVEPELKHVLLAAVEKGPLSFQDKLCLILAKENGWACVTNDKPLKGGSVQKAGMDDVMVGRIDGDIHVSMRKGVLKKCKVVIMTPDIIHTWLLSNIGDRDIVNFLLKVSLIIVDEVHTYTGVFGSNAAYLFRRIRHLLAVAGKTLQFIFASATMANPETYLVNLFGVPFTLIGEELDTSPKHEVEIVLLVPPRKEDFLSEVTKLIKEISAGPDRFIAFIDSRKQTELISSILARKLSGEEEMDPL